MRKNIDEQVVKLTFDNKDFERPAKQSTSTLGKLKDATVNVSQSITGGLSQALQRLDVTDLLKIGGLTGGLVLLKNGINDLAAPIKNVGDLALNTIKNTLNSALNQIKTGGWSRAQKIDNAKFMLKGLGLDEETFMAAADYAVSGTAYTLDAAASAAAQFGASGYKDQKQLEYMLRSISGVAAMTNRDFEEISYLWTQMAGLGRVTGMTLTSLSMKGINAAKVLADAIGKTESDVKDMVHDGQIDFDTFAKAMDDAFGEHAKDANSTFSGATANIRAALSKLGADFFSIILSSENFNKALNSVRETLNAIRNVTKPIAEGIWVSTFDLFAIDFFDAISEVKELLDGGEFFKGLTILQEFNKVLEWLLDKAKSLLGIIDHIVAWNDNMYFARIGNAIALVTEQIRVLVDEIIGVFNRSFDWFKVVESFRGRIVSFIQDIANGFKFSGMQISNIRYFISQIIKLGKRLGSTFASVFNINKFRPADVIKEFINQLTKLISKLTLSDKAIEGINKAANGLFRVFKLIFDAASEIVSFLWPIVLDIIPELIDGIAQISGWIGTLATDIVKFVDNSEIIQTVWTNVKEVIQTLVDTAGRIGASFFELFFGGEGGEGKKFFDRVGEFIDELEIIIGDAAKSLDLEGIDFAPIKEFFTNIFTLGFEKFSKVKLSLENGMNQIGSISDILGVVVVLFDNIKEFVSKIVDMAIKEKGSASLIGKPIFDVVSAFKEGIDGMTETELSAMEKIFIKICDVLMILIAAMATVVTTFAAGTGLKGFAKKIENISISIGDTIGFLVETVSGKTWTSLATVLGRRKFINADNISDLVSAIAKVIASIALLVAVVKVLDVNASDVGSIAAIMGITMGIITACLLALSIISAKMGLLTNKTTKLESMFERNGKQRSNALLNRIATGTGFGFADLAITGVRSPFGQIASALLMVAGGIALISLSIATLRLGMGGPDGFEKMRDAAILLMIFVGALSLLLGGIAYLSNRLSRGTEFKGNIESAMLSIAGSITIIGVAMNLISLSLISLSLFSTEKIASAALIMGLLVGILSAIFGLIGGLVTDPKASIAIGVTGVAVLLAFIGVAAALMSIAGACLMLSAIDVNKLEKVKKLMIPLTSIILGITAGVGVVIGIISAINPAAGAIAAVGLVAFGFALVEVAAAALMLAGAIAIAMSVSEKLVKSIGELWSAISKLFDVLSADTVSEEQLNTFKDNFASVAVSVFQGWAKGIMEGVHYISSHYKEYAGDIRNIFETIISAVPKLIADARGNGESESVTDLFMDILIPNRPHSVAEFLDRLQPIWEEQVLPAIDSFLNLINPQLNDIIKRLCDTIVVFSVTNAPIIASAAVETFLIWITAFDNAIQRDKDQIEAAVTSLLNTLGDLANEIIFDSDIWKKITSIGSNVIAGIKNGMMQALHDIPFTNALLSIGSTIYNTVCSSLGIESPSKVMKQVGDFVMQGLGIGIEEGKGGLNTTLDGLLETFTGFGDNISGVFDKFDFKITPELDTSLIDGGLSGLKDTIGNFDMSNIGSIMSTRDRVSMMPNVNDLLDATNAKMSDLLGTVYSIDQSKMNTQPINIDVALEGDTGKFFKAMVKENHRYTLANGASAF